MILLASFIILVILIYLVCVSILLGNMDRHLRAHQRWLETIQAQVRELEETLDP